MKIAVVTHWNCFENYGQVLQGYAFQQFLKHRGHEPFIIRYFPGSYFSDRLSLRRALWRLKTLKSFWNSVKCLLLLTRFRARKRRLKIAKERDFQSFKDAEMVFSKKIYRSYDEICRSDELDADVYSVGSDVVWLTVPLNDDGRIMFLDFGAANAKRIAYSASFGVPEVSEAYKKFATPLISRLDYIGVRELSGVRICREMGRADAECVVDPVFLMSRLAYVEKFAIGEHRHGVFAYLLSMKPKFPIDEIEHIAKRFGDEVSVTTVYGEMDMPKRCLRNLTIPEWIKTIGEARLFLTNSFHGASMAIILHTPFVMFLKTGGKKMDDRVLSLLERVGLLDRVYDETKSIDSYLENPIDWDLVDKKVTEYVRMSIDSLEKVGI